MCTQILMESSFKNDVIIIIMHVHRRFFYLDFFAKTNRTYNPIRNRIRFN